VEDVSRNSEVREFLVSRRARITPQQAGLPAYGSNRRVTGLRQRLPPRQFPKDRLLRMRNVPR